MKKRLHIKWKNVGIALILLLITIWSTYSVIGTFVGPIHEKQNGNTCQGYEYGFKICSGNIGAE